MNYYYAMALGTDEMYPIVASCKDEAELICYDFLGMCRFDPETGAGHYLKASAIEDWTSDELAEAHAYLDRFKAQQEK